MPRPSVKEKLIDAGLRTLHKRGFNGCAVQDITEAAGVPKGSFYNHFPSKEVLGLEALERYWQGSASRRAILGDETLSPVERLRRHFNSLSEAVSRYDFEKGCLIGNFSAELPDQSPPIRDGLAVIYAGWTCAIEICVREAQQTGQLRTGADPAAVAAFLVNAWEGAVLRAKVDKHGEALEQFDEVVFAGLFV
ncbi:TetR/AcrR family transcriptional regulator [Mesorhizobium abyssinicae]|uniref:TetR/AcrR family transcriptional regulator n=1 Tax=Mesorhizobium abyssinicae TaxID=1209958 RepID=UPI003393AF5A